MRVEAWGRTHLASNASFLQRDSGLGFSGSGTTFFGQGRSYGDVCLNTQDGVVSTRLLDRLVSFDNRTGVLCCEGGVQLGEIQKIFLPRGWCLPVTPGTQHATLGGAIANDVHGKNHHKMGTIGCHVLGLRVETTDGVQVSCSATDEGDFFAATIGGLGLTGLIREVSLQLMRVPGPWLEAEQFAFHSLEEFVAHSHESSEWDYSVAWLDGTRSSRNLRGIFSRANHIDNAGLVNPERSVLKAPFTPPVSLINPVTAKVFNQAYYSRQKRVRGSSRISYLPFFYPLDAILSWNRIYGASGFFQYQFVLPVDGALSGVAKILDLVADYGAVSPLSVLKTFGDRTSPGMLSFPMPGVTLALDFPNKGAKTLTLFDQLDKIVEAHGGRLYAAKDGRMSSSLFARTYPNLEKFRPHRDSGITSDFARRVFGD